MVEFGARVDGQNGSLVTVNNGESMGHGILWGTDSGVRKKDSTNEHGSFTFDIPRKPCSFNATPELGMLSAPCTHEDYNQLKVLFCKIFRRLVVDIYVYRKHCRFSCVHRGTNLVASFNNWWCNNDPSPMMATRVIMVELMTRNKALPGDSSDYYLLFTFVFPFQ